MNEKFLHQMGAVVHGFLVFGHALGICYNAKRKNPVDTVLHALALAYSVRSAFHHKHLS